MTDKAKFTWQDLQDAAEAAGTLWVVDVSGEWRRDSHEAVAVDDRTFKERLTALGFSALRYRARVTGGRVTKVPFVWQRLGRWNHEYLVHVYMDEQVVETVFTASLPAYLQLMRQLREAGTGLAR